MLSPIVSDIESGDVGDLAPRALILRDAPPTPNNTARGLRIANVAAFVAVLVANALGASGKLPGSKSVSAVSAEYRTDLTPSGFTFAIWSIIYTLQSFFVLFQFKKSNVRLVRSVGFGYVLACILNGAWVCLFTQDTPFSINASFCCIVLLCITLTRIYAITAGCWRTERSGLAFVCVDLGFTVYTAWVLCATAVGASIELKVNGVQQKWGLRVDQIEIILLSFSTAITAWLSFTRKDFMFPLVLAWASYGINKNDPQDPFPMATKIVAAVALFLSALAIASRLCCKPPALGSKNSRSSINNGYWR